MTREEVMERSAYYGVDMSGWEEPRIQQIVDIVNAPIEFPKSALSKKFRDNPRWYEVNT